MKTDRFFVVEIVDKFSRMVMLFFAGLVLGAVLALGYYYVLEPSIGATVTFIAIYCAIFATYVAITNSLRKITKVEIFKDKLSFVFEKKNEISSRKDVYYNDIKSYKISPLTDKKNAAKENPDKDKYSLRVFGFKTDVELFNGEKITFQDSCSDGVLIYSPSYIYRMIDVKRFNPNFPLILENFESKKEPENFNYQFKYYEELNKNLSLFQNKRYLMCLIKYTLIFTLVVAVLSGTAIAACLYYKVLKSQADMFMFIYSTLGILVGILIPMWLVAGLTSLVGGKFNLKAKNTIEKIIKE